VLNRKTGQLVSANPFVLVNWAKGIDRATGRPIEVAEKRPRQDVWARDVLPEPLRREELGADSYSSQTGLVYIPTFNLWHGHRQPTQDYKPGTFTSPPSSSSPRPGPATT